MSIAFSSTFNALWINAGVINSGTTAFSSTNGNFPASSGQNLTVSGAGVAGADLVTTVSANVSATAETLAASAGTSVAAAVWAFGAGCKASSTIGKFTIAAAINTGDLLVLGIDTDPSITVTSVTDSAGNVWAPMGAGISNADYFQRGYRCLKAAAAAANTLVVTVTFSSTPPFTSVPTTIEGAQFTGSPYGWSQDAFSTGNASSATCAVAALTTKFPNEVLFLFTGVDSHVTGISAGLTAVPTATQNRSNATFGDMAGDTGAYEIFSAIQTGITPSATQNSAAIFVVTAATFAPVLGDVIQFGDVA